MDTVSQKNNKFRNLCLVKSESEIKKDWSIPYPGAKEVGRGVLENNGKLTNIVIRYFSYVSFRIEKNHFFAEVNINEKEKFIIDGANLETLIQDVTDVVWPIAQCRRKIKAISNTKIRIVKSTRYSKNNGGPNK